VICFSVLIYLIEILLAFDSFSDIEQIFSEEMNMLINNLKLIFLMAILVFIAGCGGGAAGGGATNNTNNTSNNTNTGTSGTETAISSSGVITGFGSVFIDGVKYEVENGTVVAIEDENDIIGDDSRLRLGMKVRIEAREDENGQRFADRIEFDEDLKGPVRNVTPGADDNTIGTFTVFGITVTVDANTIFDDDVGDTNADDSIDINDLDLAIGQAVVEISGFLTTNGILATRVDRLNPPGTTIDENDVEVKGKITDASGLPVSFVLNGGITINVGTAIFDDGLSSTADLEVNQFVEVKGTLVTDVEINAEEIELEGQLRDKDREGEFEIEGVLLSVNTTSEPHEIVINGIVIPVVEASRLVQFVGKRVKIKGEFNANNVLVLVEGTGGVKTEVENSVRTADLLVSVNVSTDTLTSRLGLQITPTGLSRVDDDTRENNDHLLLDDFILGLQGKGTASGVPLAVEARGFPENGSVTWTRVAVGELHTDGGISCRLRGPVNEINPTAFTFEIMDVLVHVSGEGGDEVAYRDEREEPEKILSRTQFFERLTEGDVIQAIGNTEKDIDTQDCSHLNLIADEVEFETDDGVFGTVPDNKDEEDDHDDSTVADDELVGAPSNVDNAELTFEIAGATVQVTNNTFIDGSIIEQIRGVELNDDVLFTELLDDETLGVILDDRIIVARIIIDGNVLIVLSIEDI